MIGNKSKNYRSYTQQLTYYFNHIIFSPLVVLVFTGVPIEIHYNVYSKIIQAIIKLSLKQERPFYVYDESHTETLKIILQ